MRRLIAIAALGLALAGCQIPATAYWDEGGTLRKGPKPAACAAGGYAASDGTTVRFDTICWRENGTEILEGDEDYDPGVMGPGR